MNQEMKNKHQVQPQTPAIEQEKEVIL